MAGDRVSKLEVIGKLIFFVFILSACSSNAPKLNLDPSVPYSKLSTQEDQNLQSKNELLNQQINEELITEQIQPDADSQQQMVPEVLIEENDDQQQEPENALIHSKLPFQDFKARWNAISDEQMSNLHIKDLEESKHDQGTLYISHLSKQIELHIHVYGNYVQQLEINSKGKSTSNINEMLAAWNQVINILHPTIEVYDVDTLFNKIGVGPNADVSKIKKASFVYSHLHYNVSPRENGYTFRASYNK
jgi:hypothetical protein